MRAGIVSLPQKWRLDSGMGARGASGSPTSQTPETAPVHPPETAGCGVPPAVTACPLPTWQLAGPPQPMRHGSADRYEEINVGRVQRHHAPSHTHMTETTLIVEEALRGPVACVAVLIHDEWVGLAP